MHHGVETTLARIRSNYWIVKGRKSVKEVLRKCVFYTRYQGQPMHPPSSPDLPDYRVHHSAHAFQATGLISRDLSLLEVFQRAKKLTSYY